MKKVAGPLKLLYSQYKELAAFSQFGSDLDEDTKKRLAQGERIVEVLKQGEHQPLKVENQVMIIHAVTNDLLSDIPVNNIARFETELLDIPNFQGNAAVNYTDRETPWTRIIEHKWFEFGKDDEGNDLPKTVISREYSSEWKPGDEPYYPVNDEKNGALYSKYRELAQKEKKVVFGGRLGEYKYYDMDAVIASALDMCEKELG